MGMKLLSQKQIREKKAETSLSVKTIAEATNKKLQEFNQLKLKIKNDQKNLLEEFQVFSEKVANEKKGLLAEVKKLESRRELAKKPIEKTLKDAENIKKDAEKSLEIAVAERKTSENLVTQANEYFHLVQLFLMEAVSVLNAIIDSIVVEKSIPNRIVELKEVLTLVEQLKEIRANNEVLLSMYKEKIQERCVILDALIEENTNEKVKIVNERKHVESQQQAIKAALQDLKNKS